MKDEIEAARNHAAHKVAMFHGTGGTARFINRTGGSVFDFLAESEVDVGPLDANYAQFAERLVFDLDRDVLRLRFYGAGLFGRGG